MRRIVAFIALGCLIGTLGCRNKPVRQMRPTEVQLYDLPAADASWTLQPPEYPKSDGLATPAKEKEGLAKMQNMNGPGGGSGGANMGGIGNGMQNSGNRSFR